MAKKGKVGKVVGALVALALIGGASVYGYMAYKDYQDSKPPQETIQTLKTPDNFAFDSENYVLTWDDVQHAEGYTIVYNGENIEVEQGETSQAVLLLSTENSFKIKANGDGVNYKDSAWSDVITYTLNNTQELSLFDKTNIELSRAATSRGYTLERIIGISFADTSDDYKDSNIYIYAIAQKDGIEYNIGLGYKIDGANSIFELMNGINENNFHRCFEDDIVFYNSAQKLVESKSYDGEMESLRTQGYEISVIDSCVRKGKGSITFCYEIVGTYKATLGNDVKYFTSTNEIRVSNPASKDVYNYETALVFNENTTVTETQFIMHEEGATLEYMEKLVAQKQSVATVSLNMEYSLEDTYYANSQNADVVLPATTGEAGREI